MRYTPPEWASHKAMWTAWPSRPDLWDGILLETRAEVAGMVRGLARGDLVKVLVCGQEAEESARPMLAFPNVEIIQAPFGDIWFRDIAPVFATDNGKPVALTFRLNGWGEKYIYEHDDKVAGFIAARSHTPALPHDLILEGGAVEFDGAGRVMTTRSCLLNPNRNPELSQAQIEDILRQAFGVREVIWLDQGLEKDHTDGHIDNIARFVGEGEVVCQTASGADDPNAATYAAIHKDLLAHGLKVHTIPSPGRILYEDGSLAPASHMNYIIGNKTVVVPSYEGRYSVEAVEQLRPLFPGREVIASPAAHILTGGGSFHCITQQEPG